jgi:hypothetical protein
MALFHAFLFDNHHLSSLDRSFHLICVHMHTKICEIFSSIFNQNSFQICYPHIFKFTISFHFQICSILEPEFTSMRFPSHNNLALYNQQALVFLMGLQYFHFQDPPSYNSIFTQPNKLLASHAYIFSLQIYNGITNNS